MLLRRHAPALGLALAATLLPVTALCAPAGAEPDAGRTTPPAARAAAGWATLSQGAIDSNHDVVTHRTADGVLHVISAEQLPSGNQGYVHTSITAAGAVQRTVLPLDEPNLGERPALDTAPGGALRLAFVSTAPSEGYRQGRIQQALSTDGGLTWVRQGDVLTQNGNVWGAPGIDATWTSTGETIQAYGYATNRWRVGTIAGTEPWNAEQDAEAPGAVGYGLALLRVGETVMLAGHESGLDPALHVRQIWPTVGEAVRAPQSGSFSDARVPFFTRADSTTWAAYNTESNRALAVWRIGSAQPVRLGATDSEEYDVAAAAGGRMWAAWWGDDGLFVAHTGPRGTGFSTPQKVALPAGVTSLHSLQIDPTATGADLLVVSPNGVHRSAVRPGLTMKVKGSLKVGRPGKVKVKVTDGSDSLKGVKVRAGKTKCTTNAKGVCRLKVTASKAKPVTVKASRAGWLPTTAKVKVKR